MKRLRRVLLNGVVGASLLLCGVCAVLWARCALTPATNTDAVMMWRMEVAEGKGTLRTLRVWSREGAVHVELDRNVVERLVEDWKPPGGPTSWHLARVGSESIGVGERSRGVLGFGAWYERKGSAQVSHVYSQELRGGSVPYWAMVGVFAVLPVGWLWARRRREARRVGGRCVACGYDLRGTQAGRCPECGTAVEAEVTAS